MEKRFFDVAEVMESRQGLPAACVANESDWRVCIFSQKAAAYVQTPTFAINSLYNFAEWTILAESWLDTGVPPPDWLACFPHNGGLTPQTYAHCNATQRAIIQGYRTAFLAAMQPLIDPARPQHGVFFDSCPNQHCQTSTGGWGHSKQTPTTPLPLSPPHLRSYSIRMEQGAGGRDRHGACGGPVVLWTDHPESCRRPFPRQPDVPVRVAGPHLQQLPQRGARRQLPLEQ